MRYSLLAGGKRIRPLLLLASAEACGTPASKVLQAACAFECLHTYSLIHDDLPSMDDDDLRRGRPTNHKAFDEATAILAGDALQSLAFELMARNVASLAAKGGAEAVRVFAEAAGQLGMVGGQMADIEAEGKPIVLKELRFIHAGKTGALIRAAVECGSILAGAPAAKRARLRRLGEHLGLAFQVADDILNVVGDAQKLGKRTGSDAAHGKATYPALLGLEASRQVLEREWTASKKELLALGEPARALAALGRFIIERDH
jgi:geranylgeranyl diphosphate synthase type II